MSVRSIFNQFPLSLVLAGSLFGLAACGTEQSKDQPSTDQEGAEAQQTFLGPSTAAAQGGIVIAPADARLNVVIAGNNSCDRDMIKTKTPNLRSNAFMAKYIDAFGEGVIKTSLFICHQFLSPTVYYVFGGIGGPMVPAEVSQLTSVINQFKNGAHAVAIFGYSYGAYEAIRLGIEQLVFANSAIPLFVISIDPISKPLCNNPSTFFKTDACRQFPVDFTAENLQLLNRGAYWVNFFQESGAFYRSGPSAFAHENWRVAKNHATIDTANEVWKQIRTRF